MDIIARPANATAWEAPSGAYLDPIQADQPVSALMIANGLSAPKSQR